MASDFPQVVKAMVAAAKAHTGLTAKVSNRVYFGRAPDVAMPYVVLVPVAPDGPVRCFASGGDFEEAIVQWDIFDDEPSFATNVSTIESDLNALFDRQTVSYDNLTHIACAREGGYGPVWDGTCWQRSLTYKVIYK